MKLNFRKIASVLSSAVMISSTVALAAAATYPAPFISGGSPDVAVVFGSAPGAQLDLAAVVDVTNDLQFRLSSAGTSGGSGGTSGGSGTTVTGGDSIRLARPSNNINLGDTISGVYGSTLTSSDLPVLLVNGRYSNDENTNYDYEQKITIGTGLQYNYFSESDYKDRMPTLGFNITKNAALLNYSLDFTTSAESDITSGDLVDLETTVIKLMGKEYYISDAKNSTLSLTLLDTANSALATEGETTTITVGGKSYDVSISYISPTEVKLSVNGEETNTLSEGGTYKLSDGTYLGIKDILARDVQGVLGKVEFSLGSGKIEIRNGQSIKINDKSVSTITAEIVSGGHTGATRNSIDRINLVWTPDSSTYFTSGTELVMPALGNVKFAVGTPVRPSNEVTQVREGSADYMVVDTSFKDGAVTIPILYSNATGFGGIGKSANEKLVTSGTTTATFNDTAGDDFFVASYASSTYAESYLLRFKDFANVDGINKTNLQKKVGADWVNLCENRQASDTCNIGSLSITINSVSAYPDRAVSYTGNAGSSLHSIYTEGGLKIDLPYSAVSTTTNASGDFSYGAISFGNINDTSSKGHNTTNLLMNFVEEDRTGTIAAGKNFTATLTLNTESPMEPYVSAFATNRTAIVDPDDSDHTMSYVYSDGATFVEKTGKASDQSELKITYAGGESYIDVFLTTGGAVVSSTSASNDTQVITTTTSGVTQLGSVAVSDTEVGSVSNKNLIVVGGSCVNQVAAQLLGVSFPTCGSAWETKTGVGAGNFLVQTFSRSSGKVATLVAGFNAGDTANAVTKLRTEPTQFDITAGKAFKGNLQQVSMVEVTPSAVVA